MTKQISPENAIGRIASMDAINNKSVVLVALKQAESKLKNLHIALESINQKDFELCINWEKPIPLGRILIMPQSRFCVNCVK